MRAKATNDLMAKLFRVSVGIFDPPLYSITSSGQIYEVNVDGTYLLRTILSPERRSNLWQIVYEIESARELIVILEKKCLC